MTKSREENCSSGINQLIAKLAMRVKECKPSYLSFSRYAHGDIIPTEVLCFYRTSCVEARAVRSTSTYYIQSKSTSLSLPKPIYTWRKLALYLQRESIYEVEARQGKALNIHMILKDYLSNVLQCLIGFDSESQATW
ncbi:hypothetical protein WAI453_009861 [Rhynchosporium graminicola]